MNWINISLCIFLISLSILFLTKSYSRLLKDEHFANDYNAYAGQPVQKKYQKQFKYPNYKHVDVILTLYPDQILEKQINDNSGQLDRIKLTAEHYLSNLWPDTEVNISKVIVHPGSDGNHFVADGRKYPSYTFAMLAFENSATKAVVRMPITDTTGMGQGSEELVFSMLTTTMDKTNFKPLF